MEKNILFSWLTAEVKAKVGLVFVHYTILRLGIGTETSEYYFQLHTDRIYQRAVLRTKFGEISQYFAINV